MLQRRLAAVRERMRTAQLDALLLGPGPDLRYLSGYEAHPSERLTALLVPLDAPPSLFIPALEAPRAADTSAELVAWTEHQEPLDLIAGRLRDLGARGVGVGDHLWSRFLLGLQERLPETAWRPASEATAPARLLKSPEEIDLMRRAGGAADAVWGDVAAMPLEGMTERAVALVLAERLEAYGLEGAAFAIVASGPHSASPHHSPGERRLRGGDWVVIDYGGPLDGYHSDITRTLHLGAPPDEERRAYEAVREAQQRGVAAVRPGATVGSIDQAARSCLEEQGLGEYFIHRTGHGLGLEVHEPPYILAGSSQELLEGMVFSVEPGVYLAGRFGIRIEDIVVVTGAGCERLNNAPRALVEM